ncbi:hypothetical protein EDC01DRAFT_781029 [Geopyxis carbonaria]|nr:hypothetical protein EDC01DRAFT_781029 [Geopyxis carbonaria]
MQNRPKPKTKATTPQTHAGGRREVLDFVDPMVRAAPVKLTVAVSRVVRNSISAAGAGYQAKDDMGDLGRGWAEEGADGCRCGGADNALLGYDLAVRSLQSARTRARRRVARKIAAGRGLAPIDVDADDVDLRSPFTRK